MGVIHYQAPKRLLSVARGHPYERDAYAALCDGLEEFDTCLVEQPAAANLMGPDLSTEYDALLCYDMPGVDFTAGPEAVPVAPPESFRSRYLAMLEAGIGVVYLHHSIAAWPAWERYAEIIGGRFHYRPASLRGVDYPDSGYRHKVSHRLSVLADHPVTAGLPESFEMVDELYLCPLLTDSFTPLLASDYAFNMDNFYSAAKAVAGEMNTRDGWSHPEGANSVAWVKAWGSSPIVYIQGGDDGEAMANPHFQQLVHNAVRWVASDEAHSWARQQQGSSS